MTVAESIARWQALPARTRLVLCAAVVTIAALIALAGVLGRDTRVALFATALKPDQLAEVDAQLSAWNVAFAPGSDNIRVAPGRRRELLARLALAGVPHAHVVGTSEALASIGTLTPLAVLDAQARTGLEGDLEKGLRGIGGIADARVILAPARTGTFADEAPTQASASVRVSAAPGQSVTPATIALVRAFVAAGVPGLRADRVTVVDDRGIALDDDSADARERETAIQSALDAAFGDGATIVRVHLERNERLHAPREIRRVSIAVIVDAGRGLDVAKIRELAAAAGGIDAGRGDALSVAAIAFDRPRVARPSPGALAFGRLVEVAPALAFAVVGVVALRAGAGPLGTLVAELVRRFRFERSARALPSLSPQAIFDVLRLEPPHAAAAVIATLATPLAAAVLDLYPPVQRQAIVARLARRVSPLVPDAESLVRGG